MKYPNNDYERVRIYLTQFTVFLPPQSKSKYAKPIMTLSEYSIVKLNEIFGEFGLKIIKK